MSQTPTLVRIRIYPVKSLGGFDRDVWELDAFGLRYDRRWMIVGPDGGFMTQRDYPAMAQIAVEMQADRLILSVPMRSPVAVPLEPEPGASEPVTIWNDTVAARAVSEDANRWLGEVLMTPCRLVYMPDEAARAVDRKYVDHNAQLAFADGFPLLLTSEESLADLNRRLSGPVTMDRFRPNLVVKGVGAPYAEDTWRRIRLSDMDLQVVKPCSRCVIVTTDQDTGQRGTEPLETLAGYRAIGGDVYFGQNVVHLGHGRIRVGDDIQILETGDPIPDLETGQVDKPDAKPKPSTGKANRPTRPRMWPAEPTFEIFLPEEELEFEPNLPAEPEPEIEVDSEGDAEPSTDAGAETETEPDAKGGEAPAKPVIDDIIFPFEVDLVVTPEDLEEAAKADQAVASEAADEESAAPELVDEEVVEVEPVAEEEPEEDVPAEEPASQEVVEVAEDVVDEKEEEEEEEEEEPAEEFEEAPAEEVPPVQEPVVAKARGKARSKKEAKGKAKARDIEFILGERPEAAAIKGLYEAAGRPEVAGDQDSGRIDRAFAASNVVVAAWLGDVLVGVLRGWSDGARDGFVSDLVVHPDHVGAGIGVELVHHAMDAHPGIRWVLRASVTSPYLGGALGWTHLGKGWFVSPA